MKPRWVLEFCKINGIQRFFAGAVTEKADLPPSTVAGFASTVEEANSAKEGHIAYVAYVACVACAELL